MRSWILLTVCASLAACNGCGDPDAAPDTGGADMSAPDMGPDAPSDATVLPDTPAPDSSDMTPSGGPVAIDLAPYLEASDFDDGEPVRVFQSTSSDELLTGAVATSRPGDWVLENGVARFIVEDDVRAMSPCPFGGHLIDAAPLAMPSTGDALAEICLFVNAGSTLVPESFEVLADGSDGGAGVLAVSGRLELLDWINFTTMAADLGFGAIGDLRIGPNRIPPVYATVYYILRPGELGLRVVTALRNDGEGQSDLLIGHLIGGGGDGSYWNPLSSKQGYGTSGLSLQTLEGEPMPWVGYGGANNSGWAYVPEPNPDFDRESLPIGGAYLAVSNIVVAGLDIKNILQILIATEAQIPTHPALVHLQPGQIEVKEHWTFVGDGSMNTMLEQIYPTIGVQTGTAAGTVVNGSGEPAEGARVTAIDLDGAPLSQALTAADGSYQLHLPAGDYSVVARLGNLASEPVAEQIEAASVADNVDLALPEPATFVIHVRDPAGAAVPGRVTVICDGDECPGRPTQQEVDLETDKLPELFAGVYYADVATGDVRFDLPPGDYRVVVSRGMAWSVWPSDAVPDGGFEVTAVAGQTEELNAEIAPVVDMTGLLSVDFHVHTVSSHDSSTPYLDRIEGFVADGLDIAVSSDHDIIADYAPAIAELGAEDHIATIVGLEISTSDIGHYNAFPLEFDADHKRGGALDWAGGLDLSLTPAEMFQWIDDHPGEQVVQVNHADSLGMFKSLIADPLRGISLLDPSTARLPASEPDPITGDTGLWTEAFTAYEVANGNDLPQFWALYRWWLTMIGRGFSPTGTAVTDTHRRWSHLGTTPRSLVSMPPGNDTVSTFDEGQFVTAVNAGRVVGTNGPTLRVVLRNADGDEISYKGVIDGSSGEVTAKISIQAPEWVEVDTIDVFTNLESVVTEPGKPNEEAVEPSFSVPVSLTPADLVTVDSGAQNHRRWEKTIDIPLTISEDSYFVFIVRGLATPNMYPVLSETDALPFAWTNPFFVDFDGNGYDNPPLQDLASRAPQRTSIRPGPKDVSPTADQLLHSLHERTCSEHWH